MIKLERKTSKEKAKKEKEKKQKQQGGDPTVMAELRAELDDLKARVEKLEKKPK